MTTNDSAPEPTEDDPAVQPSDHTESAEPDERRDGPRHAAAGGGFRLQPWMIGLAAIIVVGLVVWLVVALGGDDEDSSASGSSSSTARSTSVVAATLPSLLCTGPSYVLVDTGQSEEQLLADPSAVEGQFPGSKLSTVPGGCIAGSTAVDEVVLAMGPFPTFEEACSAAQALPVAYRVYAGGVDTGLTETPCA